VRDLAGWQEDRYAIVAGWSVREALIADLERQRREAQDAFQRDCDRYMHGRQAKDAPKPPEILARAEPFLKDLNDPKPHPVSDGHERERS
jgi:hypothetical protein